MSALLDGDDRGTFGPNGKRSFSSSEAGAQITRDNLSWASALGTAATVTYAFRDSVGTMPEDTSGFSRFGGTQITAALLAFGAWSDVANITFQRVQNTGSAFSDNATILLGNYSSGQSGAAAFAYLPGSTNRASSDGDIWVNNSFNYNIVPSQQGFGQLTLVHEIGHAIGLSHPSDYDAGSGSTLTYEQNTAYFEDSRQYTVMSYFSESSTGANFGAGRYPSAALLDDISAAQRLYGANMTTRAGDTVYGVNSTAGRPWFSTTGAGSGELIFCAWDAGGIDTFNFSGLDGPQVIDLRQGTFSNVGGLIGNVSIAFGTVIENVICGVSSDDIRGNSADNRITSGGGVDTIDGGLGVDTVDFGDTYVMSAYTITWDGQVGTITGGGHNVTVRNVEFLQFGGQTIAAATTGGLIVAGDTTDETIQGSSFADSIGGLGGADTINGLAGSDNLNGGSGDDTLNGGDGDDILIGALGNDGLNGGTGNDTADYSGAGAGVTINLSNGSASGGAGLDTLFQVENATGSVHADTLTGNGEANILRGGGGIDTLIGGGGADQLFAGAPGEAGGAPDIAKTHLTMNNSIGTAVALTGGFDLGARADVANSNSIPHATVVATSHGGKEYYAFTVAAGETVVIDIDNASFDSVVRLYSADLVRLAQNDDNASDGSSATDSGLSHTFSAAGTYYIEVSRYMSGTEQAGNLEVTIPGPGATYTLHVSVPSAPAVPLEYVGSTMDGEAGADVLEGGAGRDTLTGGADDDLLAGRGGNDLIDGGVGTDMAVFSGSRSAYTVTLSGGVTTVVGPDGSDSVSNVERLQFADGLYFADGTPAGSVITGSSDADVLDGTSGVDSINGGHGDDVINPGAGNDTIDGGTGADTVVFSGDYATYSISTSGGTTTVSGADGVDFLNNVERLRFADGTYLVGAGGGQYFAGTAGADTITGTTFNDEMRGGAGNDTFVSRGGADIVDGGTGEDTVIFAGHRSDFHIYNESPTVTAVRLGATGPLNLLTSVERIQFDDGFYATNGAALYRTASGTPGSDLLVGHTGADYIRGLAGDDVIQSLGNSDLLDGGAGFDTAVFTGPRSNYVIAQEGATTTLTYSDFLVRLLNIERLQFSDIATNIAGELLGGPINGTAGADEIYGSGDNEVINGLGGDDVIDGGAGNDALAAGLGNDTVHGGAGNDVISGDGGSDVLHGDDGDDAFLFAVGEPGGSTQAFGGAGTDTIILRGGGASIDLTTNGGSAGGVAISVNSIENVQFDGSVDAGGGNRLAYGSAANNAIVALGILAGVTFEGRGGDDLLIGGGGADSLLGGDGADNVSGGDGNDTIEGGEGADHLAGGLGADWVYGGTGNDVISGDGGSDILLGEDGDDAFLFAVGEPGGATQAYGGAGTDTIILRGGGASIDLTTNGGSAGAVAISVNSIENVQFDGSVDAGGGNRLAYGSAGANAIVALGILAGVTFEGRGGDDLLVGGEGADSLLGGGDNDIIKGNGGDDAIDGGSGTDLVELRGLAADYTITAVAGGYRVTDAVGGRDGSDLLTGVETLRFSDGSTVSLPAPVPGAPQVLPALAGDKTVTAGPEVLPGATGDKALFDGPQTLPGAGDDFILTGKFDDVPPVMPTLSGDFDAGLSSVSELALARELLMTLARENPLHLSGDSLTLADDWSEVLHSARHVWE